jgi:hypothetical protein
MYGDGSRRGVERLQEVTNQLFGISEQVKNELSGITGSSRR